MAGTPLEVLALLALLAVQSFASNLAQDTIVGSALAEDAACGTSSQCQLDLVQLKVSSLKKIESSFRSNAHCSMKQHTNITGFDEGFNSWAQYFKSFFEAVNGTVAHNINFTDIGTFWVVKSDSVQIQGLWDVRAHDGYINSKHHTPFLRALVIGGPFLKGNILSFSTENRKLFWNDDEILNKPHNNFSVDDLIYARYEPHHWKLRSLSIQLPLGLSLDVNRHGVDVDVNISMPNIEEQDGLCGNFNGEEMDDDLEDVQDRLNLTVAVEDMLFKNITGIQFINQSMSAPIDSPSSGPEVTLATSHTQAGSKCQAQVVVDAGLARTGTSSFIDWMGSLGYQKYHRLDYFRLNGLQEALKENRTGEIFNSMWQQKGRFVVADTPWPWLACGVAKSQPKRGTAKFIIMERNAIDWHLSLLNLACTYIFQGSAPSSYNGVQDFCPKMLNGNVNWTTPNAEMNIIQELTEGWCREAMSLKQPSKFCDIRQQQGANSQAFKKEHPTVAQYMKQHTQIVKACVPHEDLVVVDLYDEYQEKEMKMARFLGCHGDIPTFPTNMETGHDQYLDVVGNWISEN